MDDGVGIAELFAKCMTKVDGANLVGGHRVHQPKIVDINRHRSGRVADTQPDEGVGGVRTKLDAGADFSRAEARSRTVASNPLRASPSAVARPPIPAPATRIGFVWVTVFSPCWLDLRSICHCKEQNDAAIPWIWEIASSLRFSQ